MRHDISLACTCRQLFPNLQSLNKHIGKTGCTKKMKKIELAKMLGLTKYTVSIPD
jgi:hypothetical protein